MYTNHRFFNPSSVPLEMLDPWADDFIERAGNYGRAEDELNWRCTGRNHQQWLDVPRLAVAIGVESTRTIDELDPVLSRLYQQALHRVVLVAKASQTRGALADFLEYPGVPVVLEAPPIGANWVRLGTDSTDWVYGEEPTSLDSICVFPICFSVFFSDVVLSAFLL